MSHRTEQKQAARAQRLRREQQARLRERRLKRMRWGGIGAVGLIAAVLITVAAAAGGKGSATVAQNMSGSAANGPALGATAPNFSLTDVVTGKPVTRTSLDGHTTLLFFSEGVTCQACLVQAADLQNSAALRMAGIKLVSVTTDPAAQLAQAARQYGIHTPMLADPTTSMSSAYGMIAHGGMQMPGEDGHAFMLLGPTGQVLWHRAYATMYVAPSQLVGDIEAAGA